MAEEVDLLEQRVEAWIQDDIDQADRASLSDLLRQMRGPDRAESEAARNELVSRFSGPLRFGTAGLRGRVAAGESRMNRATVVRATAGLADALLASVGQATTRGVVLGRDARYGSSAFQRDAAAVLLAKGFRVWLLPDTVPTPVVPFSVQCLDAAAGIMITASHNPGCDNGYKVYWSDGAQIAAPIDSSIARSIDVQPSPNSIALEPPESHFGCEERPDLIQKYLETMDRVSWCPNAPVQELEVVYTPLHGVGGAIFLECCRRRGISRILPVQEQFDPNPAFPTVTFPNPEEPDALRLAMKQAEIRGADLVVAHDPDADRLAVVVKEPTQGWLILSGNQIGSLLAHYILQQDEPNSPQRLVVNTLVSSRLLEEMAKQMGVQYEETLTGFKHIAKAMMAAEERGLRAVFGYEEALGYAVSPLVRDKDGISAGLLILELAAALKGEGKTLWDQLATIHRKYGLWVSLNWSIGVDGLDGPAQIKDQMDRFRTAPRAFIESLNVVAVRDLTLAVPSIPLVIFELHDGGRLSVRPSGTEPKLKFYLEHRVPWPESVNYADAQKRASLLLQAAANKVAELVGGTFS
ncbi:MAG: phospho-sugar mutase [Myxococcales bacterium]|nr:phospho-sugar mutase [Myxococcales bacterium]